ncbi:MAG: BCCT family transporter [Gammaproteobacteria bacterium]|nr:BCCT family transporter [Gammaproteobacteria bacterium]MCW8840645.1 BCCT family transporter [Gammaproteobacteria bacterium]MCW8957790.1 BCCT family transporter [Gammaproteobacteria bacterium]MCW8972777.1 BCCT family transporter [Gammaproteobacteria bacterium]MCW8994094.1 BCCT family transporter [Gammaproteobacteria bacterium]
MDKRPGWVFYTSLLILAGFVALGLGLPEAFTRGAEEALEFTTRHFGWLYLFITTGFLVFCISVAMSDYGHIRLGADGEAPEFSYTSWLGMIFSAGMGVGLVFWGVAEPMTHYVTPPLGAAEPSTPESAGLAMRYSLFHWGFHQWANFGVVGLAIAYVRFRQQRAGLISEAFRSTLGDRVDGGVGHAINVLAVVSTVFGVATTLGLGMIQVNSGMASVFGVSFGTESQLAILAGVGIVFLLCSLAPLESGIRYVSDANMLLAGGLLLFVFFAGPTDFITAAMTNAIGDYFSNLIGMSLVMTPYTGEDWVERWTIFYWAWGLSWAPFVGSFIARISRGRTIREFVLGVIGMPVLLSAFWFATFGGSALYFELFEGAGLGEIVTNEMSAGLFAMLGLLPGAEVLAVLMLVLIVLFVITSANSATFVLGMFTGKGVLVPRRWLRLIWGVAQVLVAGVLLLSGGLGALQTISIVAAFPFMILMVFMAGALLKSLRIEQRQIELHQALMQERLQRLLDEHDSQQGADYVEPWRDRRRDEP